MNHYERLKVTQDAPPEVIRAAYRALAQALPQDEHREARLIELNAAYETLIDPDTRQAYDTVLAVSVPDIVVDEDPNLDITLDELALSPDALSPGGAPGAASEAAQADPDMGDPWQGAYEASAYQPPKHWTRQPLVWMAGGVVLLMMAAGGVALWQMQKANQLSQGMAVQLGEAASAVPDELARVPMTTDTAGALSVEDLSRLSDEELLEVLPALDEVKSSRSVRELSSVASPSSPRGAASARHPLDGAPLNLRTEGELIDPLAPTASSPASPRGR
ncbi:MAG: J domain-containing protein [Aquabacterium sp.]|uniref:J domain-containing protein n=1 Tax=Aquabacterium sp. TaxID=1872578 RepID=UPI002A364D9D|nr:J domain-containing protein [Aquabacterium sp.]MDX9843277.1 J domain-containing protein [Aquabacterium sp.]